MQAFRLEGGFGVGNLKQVELPNPAPGPLDVRVRVKAVSLNYRDWLTVEGHYNPKQPLPLIPCSDGMGVVDAVGPAVTRFAVGDRVMGCFARDWLEGEPTPDALASTLGGPLDGWLAEEVVLPEASLVRVPTHLHDAEAATLPCAGVTAWSALMTHGRIQPGETVLVQGTGGVSIFALQLAKLAGATVYVTSKSDAKLERAKALGADRTLNYVTHPTWAREVVRFTHGRGVDHVVEVGGAGTLAQSLRAVRMAGTVSVIGVLSGRETELDLAPVLMRKLKLQGILVGSREELEALARALEANHDLRPVVDTEFPFEQAPQALEALAKGEHFGKLVIRVAGSRG